MNVHVLRHFEVVNKTGEEIFYDLYSSLLSDERLKMRELDKKKLIKIKSLIVTGRRTIKDLMDMEYDKIARICKSNDINDIMLVLVRIRQLYYSPQVIKISELG